MRSFYQLIDDEILHIEAEAAAELENDVEGDVRFWVDTQITALERSKELFRQWSHQTP